ncbi:histone deacetylase 4 isoform X3 [Tachysurus fulvidraco]|uniref:histone deacetylase 4 isoform X3 n=1 Tax=Tachysurus fulvidraco TaxID=1234273 RepID=UPI001FEDC11E|nr:histone deacetylase 4 isoform X3 [Tachysurus fulvidraco]
MASEEVKQKLQSSILRRQSYEQAKTPRETEQSSELNSQQEQPNTPPSPQHTASEGDLRHKTRSRWRNPVRNSFHSSSNSTCQFSPHLDQSDHMSQLWDCSVQVQMDTAPRCIGPVEMWIQAPVIPPPENMSNNWILLKHAYVATAVYNSPQQSVLPGVSVRMRQHSPLHRCQSQPLILHERPIRNFQNHSFKIQKRTSNTHKISFLFLCKTIPSFLVTSGANQPQQHHPQVEERMAVQERGRVMFVVGEGSSTGSSGKFYEEQSSDESSSDHKQWRRRPALRMHNRSRRSSFTEPNTADSTPDQTHRTGLVYDPKIMTQQCMCGDVTCAIKHPPRIPLVFNTLLESGVIRQCEWITGPNEALHTDVLKISFQNRIFACSGANPPSPQHISALRVAAGSVMNLMMLITQGQLRNGFAIVQTDGHDVSHSSSHCTAVTNISPVAIAAKLLQENAHKKRILILDWDVHHCSTTQEMFYTDPNILHISLHRYGNSLPSAVGLDDGVGFNVNVQWSCDHDSPIGDAEYLAAFRTVIRPIAQQFCPELILISTEFNSVTGHPKSQSGPRVSAQCFGLLTQNLMDLCGGRVIVVLERGHDVTPVCEASTACVSALLENKVVALSEDVLMKKPCAAAVQSLYRVLEIHGQYWSSVRALIHTVGESWLQTEGQHSVHTDTASALALLSVTPPNYTSSKSSRSCSGGNEPVEHDEDEDL